MKAYEVLKWSNSSILAVINVSIVMIASIVGLLFFKNDFPDLPNYYLWAIRLSIIIFVIFSFEGFAMGSKLSHTVGALNDNSNWFIVGWSKTFGDLRVSHFIGMHALQVLPLVSYYVLKNTKLTIAISVFYGILAMLTLIQALQGRPLFKAKNAQNEISKIK